MFSVIIPVHNAEKTIRRCLDSLVRQTYGDFEAILVENGSSDASYSVCQEYAVRDSRFKVHDIGICGGPSKPRNFGLDKATGEYIAFLDSDDWIEPNHLELISKAFEHSEIVFCGYSFDNEEGKCEKEIVPIVNAEEKESLCYELIKEDCFGYSCCIAFMRKKLGDVRFDESINLFEDLVFTANLVEGSSQLSVIPFASYHYVQSNPEGMTKLFHRDMIQKKDAQFKAHCSVLGKKYYDYLVNIANDYVSFCVNYSFENSFCVWSALHQIKSTSFYAMAENRPNKWAEVISKGFVILKLKYIIYRLKQFAHNIKKRIKRVLRKGRLFSF